jgi:hypothetical protein
MLTVLAVLYLVLAIVTGERSFWVEAAFILAIDAIYLYATLRSKFVVWAELLDQLKLRGDERILDLGCGRGAVLMLAAQHLTTGRAVGWTCGKGAISPAMRPKPPSATPSPRAWRIGSNCTPATCRRCPSKTTASI